MPNDRRESFLLRLAEALHAYGTPTHRLEASLEAMARALEVDADFLVTPTSIVTSFDGGATPRTHLARVEPGETNLEKLSRLNELMRSVEAGGTGAEAGEREVGSIVDAAPRYPRGATVTAYALASGMAAILFGGGAAEVLVTFAVGGLIGGLAVLAVGLPRLAGVFPALAAFIASGLPVLADRYATPVHPFIPTLAGLIVLIPGLTLTLAINELAHRHLVSGTARVTGALLTLLQIGLGAGVGWRLWGGLDRPEPAEPLSGAWIPVALALSVPAFVVLFRARPSHAWTILVAVSVAFATSRAASAGAGPVVGAAVGAFLLGATSNLVARLRDQPSAIGLLPGLLLLVPGSLGFRSIAAMLSDDVLEGIQAAFSMGLVAVALVTGLLLANLVLPSRRWL